MFLFVSEKECHEYIFHTSQYFTSDLAASALCFSFCMLPIRCISSRGCLVVASLGAPAFPTVTGRRVSFFGLLWGEGSFFDGEASAGCGVFFRLSFLVSLDGVGVASLGFLAFLGFFFSCFSSPDDEDGEEDDEGLVGVSLGVLLPVTVEVGGSCLVSLGFSGCEPFLSRSGCG